MLLDGLQLASNVRLSYSSFVDAELFTQRQPLEDGVSVGSVIVSATVVGETIENLDELVQISFGREMVRLEVGL